MDNNEATTISFFEKKKPTGSETLSTSCSEIMRSIVSIVRREQSSHSGSAHDKVLWKKELTGKGEFRTGESVYRHVL